jgi:hypothetical protein
MQIMSYGVGSINVEVIAVSEVHKIPICVRLILYLSWNHWTTVRVNSIVAKKYVFMLFCGELKNCFQFQIYSFPTT